MAALAAGVKAPEFALSTLDGKPFVLSQVLERGPVVLAFFKVSCPTCQYAFPYLERLYQVHKANPVTIVGISQDNKADTGAFCRQFGVTFPILLDEPPRYRVSNDCGLSNVPTIFLVGHDRTIELSSVGWVRSEMEQLNSKLAMESAMQKSVPIFRAGDEVAEFKAG